MNMLRPNIFQLLALLTLVTTSLQQFPTVSQRELVNFINQGLKNSVAPCDNFYEYVCGNHSSSNGALVQRSFRQKLFTFVQSDRRYPTISKALLDYTSDCVKFATSNTYKLQSMQRYLEGYLNLFVDKNVTNPLESLLKLTISVPIVTSQGIYSPTGLITAFSEKENQLTITLIPDESLSKIDDLGKELMHLWEAYLELANYVMPNNQYSSVKTSEAEFRAFVDSFQSIVKESEEYPENSEIFPNIKNRPFRDAIVKTISYYTNGRVNTESLDISWDATMIDNLNQLFLRYPREGKYFLMSTAVYMVGVSLDFRPIGQTRKINSAAAQEACLVQALQPTTSGTIFNIYAANLLIRNQFPTTTVTEQLIVRNMIDSIRSQIQLSLVRTPWLQNDRELLRNIDILQSISKNIGLPEDVYNEKAVSAELNRFKGFRTGNDMIQKVLRLRYSHLQLIAEESKFRIIPNYFSANARFVHGTNELELLYLLLFPPYFSQEYPVSYNYGLLGSTIGHEFFHRFTPPFNPSSWTKYTAFNKTLQCYTDFYNGLCYDLKHEDGKMEKVCADGENDLTDNIPDVEGARAAFQAMKAVIGERRLKELAMAGFPFTNEQMFFVGYAQFYCDTLMQDGAYFVRKLKDESDTHAPGRVRVDAVAMQMEEFQKAFSCKPTNPMVIEKDRTCHLLSN